MKRGILVLAYGGPNKPEDIEPFYTDIRRGRPPSKELLDELTERYAMIGGSSPLLRITTDQANGIEQAFEGVYKTYIGMRHWEPWIPEALAAMHADGIEEAVAIVMAPHYSKMSIGKYYGIVDKYLEEHPAWKVNINRVESWHTHPKFIEACAKKIEVAFQQFSPEERNEVMMILSAHSLPVRIREWNDPYESQLQETSKLIAEKLNHKKWMWAFQSEGRTPEPWLGPDICKVMEDLHQKGENNIVSYPIGFICDHLEVIFDIDIEAGDIAKKNGMKLVRAASLNDDDTLIAAFKDIISGEFAKFESF